MKRDPFRISRKIGRFTLDRRVIAILIFASLAWAAWAWLQENPQHNPYSPLDLRDPPGWATASKLAALKNDTASCRAVLDRSEIAFEIRPPSGEGACARPDQTLLSEYPLAPSRPASTCSVAVGLALWRQNSLEPAARELFGSELAQIQHLGTFSCRRLYGRNEGPWSEHATGNAIDIAGFTLTDGTRISVLNDWSDDGAKGAFLRRAQSGACASFATVLSPDYNGAHADHFHLDQASRWSGVCR